MEIITWRDRFGVDWAWVSKHKMVIGLTGNDDILVKLFCHNLTLQ